MTTYSAESLNRVMAPCRHAACAMLEHAERLAHLQFETSTRCTDLMLMQARALMEVHDSDTFREYLSCQQRVAQGMGDELNRDLRELGNLGRTFSADLEKVTRESSDVLRSTAAEGAAANDETPPRTRAS